MAQTRVSSGQVRHVSTTTGTHELDDYLAAAERGGKTLGQLIGDLFTTGGALKANAQFRINGTGDGFEYSTDGVSWTNMGSLGGLVDAARAWAEGTSGLPAGALSAKAHAEQAKQWRDQAAALVEQIGAGGGSGSDLEALAGRAPALDLLLVATAGLPAGWFRRLSTATVTITPTAPVNAAAVQVDYGENQPRFLFSPTGASRGLLMEPARTNYILNSGQVQAQSIALQPGVYTVRSWGRTSGVLLTGLSSGTRSISNTPYTFALSTATTLGIALEAGGETVVPRAIQLENGPYGTSYIPTGSAPATRQADELSPMSSSWLNPTEGTIFVEYAVDDYADGSISGTTPSAHYAFQIDDGTQNNAYYGGKPAAAYGTLYGINRNGSPLASATTASLAKGTLVRAAVTYRDGAQRFSQGGVTIGTAAASGAMPLINRCILGRAPVANSHLNGPLRRFAYWPVAVDESHQNALTLYTP